MRRVAKAMVIVGGVSLLGLLLLAATGMYLSRARMPGCEVGPLQAIDQCRKDHDATDWMGSAYWYSDATGPLAPAIAQAVRAGAGRVTIVQSPTRTIRVPRVDCAVIVDTPARCYATQWRAANGNTRYFVALIVQENSDRARYFHGSQAVLRHGAVEKTGHAPAAGIPELEQ